MPRSADPAVRHSGTVTERLTDALLDGKPVVALARDYGLAVTQSYSVAALAIPGTFTDSGHTEHVVRCIRRELQLQDPQAMSRLSPNGGTILLPVRPQEKSATLNDVLTRLSVVAQMELTAVSMISSLAQIPVIACRMHGLLDVALALNRTGRVHQPDDLTLEWQLLQPGPAREGLVAVADSLEQRPELLETLRLFAYVGLDRRHVARTLHVHPNTVDYRLKRVADLTGHDPLRVAGLWYLRSALTVWIARSNSYAAL